MATKKKATKKKTKKKAAKRTPENVRIMTLEEAAKIWILDGNVLRHPTKKNVSIDLAHDCIEDLCLGQHCTYKYLDSTQKELIAEEIFEHHKFRTEDGRDLKILSDGTIEANCGDTVLDTKASKDVYDKLHLLFGPKPTKKVKK